MSEPITFSAAVVIGHTMPKPPKHIGEIIDRVPFCGCGDPDTALEELKLALEAIYLPEDTSDEAWKSRWEKKLAPWKDRMPPGVAYMIWYMLDDAWLLEHGGSVPGWLTKEGNQLLEFLQAGATKERWEAAHAEWIDQQPLP